MAYTIVYGIGSFRATRRYTRLTRPVLNAEAGDPAKFTLVIGNQDEFAGDRLRRNQRVQRANGCARALELTAYVSIRSRIYGCDMNGFLLDANIYPGSSGSLVVLAPENCGCNKSSGLPPYILGIVSGSIPIFDASLRAYSRIGLGMVYSADTIREVLDSFSR